MKVLENLYYTENHEWVRVEESKAYVGISDYAQHSLGEIVFVELPEEDDELNAGDVLGVVESVKAASDLFVPISGTVLEVNEHLEDQPELLNEDPYQNFIAVIEISDESELDELMNSKTYTEFCDE
ncbi:glycine cleavage system protein GcvH [Haloplasma contractile]|uniref:Glycine cleavage system H protein n=1 Tax=Haloplasma contractile SSD-17B TaxID=1033810 RepID=U2EG50_9MOLU|nr:glycine cleavage system protein GcvH [Haloplasma contractile]ERJ13883.1 Glycine cleavage system H protein [Haloplasma contractile SSD-17B]